MGRPKKKDLTLSDIARQISSGMKDAGRKHNAHNYAPHDKQLLFHTSEKKGKLYAGGNRSGKTTGGIVEDIWWLTGTHPFRKTPEPPVIGRIVTVDFKNGWEKIIRPVLKQWIPKSYLKNGSWEDSWDGQKYTLTLSNDSELEVMSQEQDLDKFAGVPRHFIHFDEECSKSIFGECKARLVDYGGSWWMTMTPVDGMTWTYEEIYEPSVLGQNPLIEVVEVDMTDNPYISQEEIDEFLSGLDEEEREIRGQGKFVAVGGLMLKMFRAHEHVIPAAVPPANWKHYLSLDHGFANPTAWMWHAVSPSGVVVTYDEHYKAEMTVEQHAKLVIEKEAYYRKKYGIVPELRIADPAIKQRSAVTGLSIQIEYSLNGLNIALGQERSVDAGINKMNTYFNNGMWFITDNCINFLKEIKKYRHKTFMSGKIADRNNRNEAPQKKDDHACDSARYFFSFQPELSPRKPEEEPRMSKEALARMMGAGTTFNPFQPILIDPNFQKQNFPEENGVVVIPDEYVGEW